MKTVLCCALVCAPPVIAYFGMADQVFTKVYVISPNLILEKTSPPTYDFTMTKGNLFNNFVITNDQEVYGTLWNCSTTIKDQDDMARQKLIFLTDDCITDKSNDFSKLDETNLNETFQKFGNVTGLLLLNEK